LFAEKGRGGVSCQKCTYFAHRPFQVSLKKWNCTQLAAGTDRSFTHTFCYTDIRRAKRRKFISSLALQQPGHSNQLRSSQRQNIISVKELMPTGKI
jgi:hypothetical protein